MQMCEDILIGAGPCHRKSSRTIDSTYGRSSRSKSYLGNRPAPLFAMWWSSSACALACTSGWRSIARTNVVSVAIAVSAPPDEMGSSVVTVGLRVEL